MPSKKRILLSGSIVLDIIPVFNTECKRTLAQIFAQGKANDMNGTYFYIGGQCGNSGLGMKKLGADVTVVSQVGIDLAGRIIQDLLKEQNIQNKITEVSGVRTSSTVVIAPPGADRVVLHSRGASQICTAKDYPSNIFENADLFHFGYPPAMINMCANDGEELEHLFKKAKDKNVTTSLDMCLPDMSSPMGSANWNAILDRVLPLVDIFVPSIEEMIFMLEPKKYFSLLKEANGRNIIDFVNLELVQNYADQLIEMGPKIVLLKLGYKGLYLRTAKAERFLNFGKAIPSPQSSWEDRELLDPAFHVETIRSTAGAGDLAIAGFLTALSFGTSPEIAIRTASGAAAVCISSYDTAGNLMSFECLQDNMKTWSKEPLELNEKWRQISSGCFVGGADSSAV